MPVFASPDPAWQLTFAPPLALWVLLAVPLLTSGLVGVLLVTHLLGWWSRQRSTLMQVHSTLVLLGGMAFIFFLDTWNLLGFRFSRAICHEVRERGTSPLWVEGMI